MINVVICHYWLYLFRRNAIGIYFNVETLSHYHVNWDTGFRTSLVWAKVSTCETSERFLNQNVFVNPPSAGLVLLRDANLVIAVPADGLVLTSAHPLGGAVMTTKLYVSYNFHLTVCDCESHLLTWLCHSSGFPFLEWLSASLCWGFLLKIATKWKSLSKPFGQYFIDT